MRINALCRLSAWSLNELVQTWGGPDIGHAHSQANELGQAIGFHLLHDVRSMDLDGAWRDIQGPRDFLVCASSDDEREHFALAAGQLSNALGNRFHNLCLA